MEKFVVPSAPPQNPNPSRRLPRWSRALPELTGRIPARHRHAAAQLLLDSFAEAGDFGHNYHVGSDCCPTHMARLTNSMNPNMPVSLMREGVSGLDFDTKGIYLASVTKSGCLTVHDFEVLYCTIYGPSSSPLDDEARHLLHLSTSQPLDAVRWNLTNQDEIACASRQTNKVLIFDIGYISSEPIEVLEKGKSKLSGHACELFSGLSDITFASADKSRLLASGLDGSIHLWDRRLSNLSCVQLTNNSQGQLNSIQLDMEDRIVFGASKHGVIYAWDLRGGRTSFAFQSHNQVYCPVLTSVKVSSVLENIPSLKAQSDILSREIHSISFNPSCPYQLAFHLDDGWSGVLNISDLNVTHVHCPPPAWLDSNISTNPSDLRKSSWLPKLSIYAVGCSSSNGVYLLDFHPDTSAACHVDFNEELQSIYEESKQSAHNKFIPTSQSILVCAAHPLNGTIIAGTKQSSLLVVSQKLKGLDMDCTS